MSSPTVGTPVSGIRISSVVPGKVTGDDVDYPLANMSLALKLHYIRAFFYTSSGRIRRSETGRPFIKCNDSGVRIVEAFCDKTIEELLEVERNEDRHFSVDSFLAHDQVLGPDLGFSPLIYIQFTRFKCGGMSVGLSWAHVLGDPFSASTFINMWGQYMKGHVPLPSKSLHMPPHKEPEYPLSTAIREPFSLKRVDPVGDYWLTTNNCKMETHCFLFTAKQLDNIVSNIFDLVRPVKISHFEIISAMIWKSLSKVRGDSGPKIVTICTRNSCTNESDGNEVPSNKMVFSIVRTDFHPAKGDLHELAALIADKQEEENSLIEEAVDSGNGDYIAYGTNLTFVSLEEADIYGLELKEHKPVFAYYTIKGVGDEGAVLVLPGKSNGSRAVTVILPESRLADLKNELRKEWGIV
ncbi:protein ECERIFERUM 2 isoform X2 [Manihot esculenta]|uniref:Uncharacterized protein n=1 Tax=Manihot esculenta TaxID=3983 RepID=A0ACB7I614_MANES|nr:protein ECERIFERUM 2 isoform X2 [Manihot esculenta]KAG8660312.1 hypothetical protein MANES_02G144500v8 [Manihot esculenta]